MKKIIIAASILTALVVWVCCTSKDQDETEATYAGNSTCQGCHTKEYNDFLKSDHIRAMDSATDKTVKANFNNSSFNYFGSTADFYKKGNRYFVKTTDTSGVLKEFEIAYTFGHTPLQQYVIAFSDGRKQVLPYCWDTRPAQVGGQRWFHLYGNEEIKPSDELFWQHYSQNWNYMCADCHTTGLQQNFDVEANTFNTTYTAMGVNCESCHGPGSKHIAWTKNKSSKDVYKGFGFSLKENNVSWVMNKETGIAQRNTARQHDLQVQTCARCHSRSIPVAEKYNFGHALLWSHIPDNAGPESFYIDGQQKEEDYEHASFLQSKMYAAGVTCSNCHNAHSGELIQPGNLLCASCHAPEKFDTEAHTHHPVNTTGASCVSCHMPGKNYMQIDYRLDHSIRIPRPDLGTVTGSPDACTQCHSSENKQSIIASFKTWYGTSLEKKPEHYGVLLHSISNYKDSAFVRYTELLSKPDYPDIMKATSFRYATQYPTPGVIQEIQKNLESPNELLRYRALETLGEFPADQVSAFLTPLLNDATPTIRMEAARILAPVHTQLDAANRNAFDQAIEAYISAQKKFASRPETCMNLGIIYTQLQRYQEAEKFYMIGLQRYPMFQALYINVADLYRSVKNEESCKKYLEAGISRFPQNAALQQALGYWYIRQQKTAEGMTALKRAMELQKDNAEFTYSYAIGLYSTGKKQEGISLLKQYLAAHPNDPAMLNALISIYQGEKQDASNYTATRQRVFGY